MNSTTNVIQIDQNIESGITYHFVGMSTLILNSVKIDISYRALISINYSQENHV